MIFYSFFEKHYEKILDKTLVTGCIIITCIGLFHDQSGHYRNLEIIFRDITIYTGITGAVLFGFGWLFGWEPVKYIGKLLILIIHFTFVVWIVFRWL